MIKLTLPQWYGFVPDIRVSGSAPLTKEEWDRLRALDPAFGFGASREEWQGAALSNPELRRRATLVADLVAGWGAERVVSVGVGTGLVEFLLKSQAPELHLRCGDWAGDSLQLLRERFVECDVIEEMDLRDQSWASDPEEVVLLNRVDTELTDREWLAFFAELAGRGARRVVWIPCGLLTLDSALQAIRPVLAGIARGRRLGRAGYLRTDARMEELFGSPYQRERVIPAGSLPIWSLLLRKGGESGE